MHATSTYPLPPEEANLRMITTLQRALPACRWATPGTSAACRSRSPRSRWARSPSSGTSPWTARCGARTRPPRWSRRAWSALVRDIRIIEQAMGDGVKRVFPGELARCPGCAGWTAKHPP